MNVVIGSDHGGYGLKTYLLSRLEGDGYQVDDVGTHSLDSVDYPDFADQVCKKVKEQQETLGILICGTGVGMSIAANRNYEIRAALCHDEYSARMSREHNDANVLCLGARVIGKGLAAAIVATWLHSSFSGGRHQRRVDKYSR
jgi:ribose 5-phosphate isomerase B